jgi:hypothetical protein
MLKVVDRFTTRDGSWEPSNLPFSITQIAAEKYKGIPGAGGAAHIFVKAPVGSVVDFYTTDGKLSNLKIVDASGWCNFNLWASSAFWGKDNGPWAVSVNGTEVARGLGLPEGLHVSTFLVVEDVGPGVKPVEPGTADKYQLFKNGVEFFAWES